PPATDDDERMVPSGPTLSKNARQWSEMWCRGSLVRGAVSTRISKGPFRNRSRSFFHENSPAPAPYHKRSRVIEQKQERWSSNLVEWIELEHQNLSGTHPEIDHV